VDINTGQSNILLMTGGGYRGYVTGSDLVAAHTTKPKTVMMSSYDYKESEHRMETGTHTGGHRADSGWSVNLYEVDTRTGSGRIIEEGTPFTTDWVVDKDGRALARSEWNPEGNVYRILAKGGLGWHEIFHKEKQGMLALVGTTADGAALVARRACFFRAPVLIMYSTGDTVVSPTQSQEMERALKQSGKDVKLVKLEGDDHWFSRPQTRTQMLKELDTFLAAQLH
jgi:pimeloyl-ACP methyl ester carboxylesterase